MRTRLMVPFAIVLLTVALTMGIAAAGAPPYPPDVHGGGGSGSGGNGTEQSHEGEPADASCVLPTMLRIARPSCP
jgi:hypothetical protein